MNINSSTNLANDLGGSLESIESGEALEYSSQASFTKTFMQSLGISKSSDCTKCSGLGFVYIKGASFQRTSDTNGFQLCSCIEKTCLEDKCYPPYERYDEKEQRLLACECRSPRMHLKRIQYLEKRSQIPYKYAGRFLDSIFVNSDNSNQSNWDDAFYYADKIISEYSQKNAPLGLYLSGTTGCGKTLLSCSILNELIRFHKIPVRYAKISRDILSKIRASYSPNSGSYGEAARIEASLREVPALVIDDFEIYRETEWVQSILYDLIDARYENNLLTIINSNQLLSFWKEMAGGRIYSRLREMCPDIHIKSPDYRTTYNSNESYH